MWRLVEALGVEARGSARYSCCGSWERSVFVLKLVGALGLKLVEALNVGSSVLGRHGVEELGVETG